MVLLFSFRGGGEKLEKLTVPGQWIIAQNYLSTFFPKDVLSRKTRPLYPNCYILSGKKVNNRLQSARITPKRLAGINCAMRLKLAWEGLFYHYTSYKDGTPLYYRQLLKFKMNKEAR